MTIAAIASTPAPLADAAAHQAATLSSSSLPTGKGGSFSQFLADGIQGVNDKLVEADTLVREFAVDDSIPVHQVTYALEQARLSFELMLQVRSRLLEAYQQLMNMQL
jgi:flagellar hook-basal body complex protein FliE